MLRLPAALAGVAVIASLTSTGLLPLDRDPTSATATAPPMAFRFGQENSWVRVQNIGVSRTRPSSSPTTAITARCSPRTAARPPACPPVGPGQGWTFFTESNPALPSGYQGSAVVESDQPIVALYAKDVRRNGAFMIDGNTTTTLAGSSRMYLPLIANRDGAQGDWNGRFALQNLSDTTACVTITYLSNYTDGEIAWDPYKAGTNGPQAVRLPQRRPPHPRQGHALPRPRHLRRACGLHRLRAHRDAHERAERPREPAGAHRLRRRLQQHLQPVRFLSRRSTTPR